MACDAMILVATGLRREARLLAGPDIRAIVSGKPSRNPYMRLRLPPTMSTFSLVPMNRSPLHS